MSKKLHNRLVSKGRYAWLIAGRTTLIAVAIILYTIGVGTFFLAMIMFASCNNYCIWVFFAAFGICGLASFFFGSESKVERVVPITKHTTSSLPPEETLVRASGLPPSNQQSELLRGVVPPTSETPPEELLRANTNSTGT